MTGSNGVVLMLEDDPGVARLQQRRLVRARYETYLAMTAAEARRVLETTGIDLLLLDYRLPDAPNGLDFYQELKAAGKDLPVIMVTAQADDRTVVTALRAGVRDYVTKSPEYLEYLPEAVRRVLEQERNTRERRRAEEALRDGEKRLAADLANMNRLHEVSTRLVRTGDPTTLLLEIVDAAIAVTAADMGNIQLLDPDSGELRIVASRGFAEPFLEYFHVVRDGEASCGMAMRIENRVVVEDVTTSPVFVGTPALDVMLEAGARAVCSTPLVSRTGRLVGMISTHYRTPHVAAEQELRVIDLLARQAADWIERVQAEAKLRESQARLELAQQAGRVGIFDWDIASGRKIWDKESEALSGLPPGTLEGDSGWAGRIHPVDQNRVQNELERCFCEQRVNVEFDYRVEHSNGEIRWVTNRGRTTYDLSGRPIRMIGTTVDITDRKRAEEALRKSEDRLTAIIEQLPVGVGVVQTDGSFVIRNSIMRDVASEVVPYKDPGFQKRWRCRDARGELVPPDRWPGARALRGENVRTGMEFICTDEEGNEKIELLTAVPFHDNAGKVGGAIMVAQDITERKRVEKELRAANRKLEQTLAELQRRTEELAATTQQLWQAAKLASVGELAASLAHELNNPLGTISLRLEGVLSRTLPDDPCRPALEVIEQEVERMVRLIANLLQFSRQTDDQTTTVDLAGEATRTAELAEYHLRRREIAIAFDFASAVPPVIVDRQKLRQLFLNLFTNAADAMPEGGTLTTRVFCRSVSSGQLEAVVEVADTGVGIPADVLPRVMDPFFTTKAEGKGTGLGLAICRRIVHDHKGTMTLESEPGRGTTVRIVFPAPDSASQHVPYSEAAVSGSKP